MQATTIGLDRAKKVFHVHGVDEHGKVVVARNLRRGQVIEFFKKVPPCLVGMEACATAHHWAREPTGLRHSVRLMRARYVKAYVKRSKNEGDLRGGDPAEYMRFVAVKTVEQQAALMLHRSRDLLIRQRTQLINAVRAHLAEIGIVAATGVDGLKALFAMVREAVATQRFPEPMQQSLQALVRQLLVAQAQADSFEREIAAQHKESEASRRLETIPGIGVLGATATVATVTDPMAFRSGRKYAAWIGLVPRQNSTGGKQRLGGISKQGDRYLYIVGAMAVIRQARVHPEKHSWLTKLLAKKPPKVAAVALANKMARVAWALLVKGGTYRAPVLAVSS